MKKSLSLILCLCLAASLLTGLSARAGAETPPEERDLIILFTSDVHCAVDQGWGYTGLYAVKEKLSKSENVLLADCGDAIQGGPIGLLTGGDAIVSIMNVMGYDAAIPGNHEFDYGVEQFLALTEKANFPYLSCNFTKNGEPVLKPWLIKETGGMKIGFVGVTTPNTMRSSFPGYFQDENGNFIYGFMEDETGEAVYGAVQKAADEVRAAGADFVIVLGHLGNESGSAPWMYSDVISHCSGIDAWIDGHSHDSEQVVMKDRDGRDVVRSACGTRLNEIGALRITREGEISSELFTWASSLPASKLLGLENAASEAVSAETDDLNRLLNDGFAVTDYTLCMNDPESAGSDGRPVRLIRRTETNLGDLCADAFLDQGGSDIAFVTGGCIRDQHRNVGSGKHLKRALHAQPSKFALVVNAGGVGEQHGPEGQQLHGLGDRIGRGAAYIGDNGHGLPGNGIDDAGFAGVAPPEKGDPDALGGGGVIQGHTGSLLLIESVSSIAHFTGFVNGKYPVYANCFP